MENTILLPYLTLSIEVVHDGFQPHDKPFGTSLNAQMPCQQDITSSKGVDFVNHLLHNKMNKVI